MEEQVAYEMFKEQVRERCADCSFRWEGFDSQNYCSVDGFNDTMRRCEEIPFCGFAAALQRLENYPSMDGMATVINTLRKKVI